MPDFFDWRIFLLMHQPRYHYRYICTPPALSALVSACSCHMPQEAEFRWVGRYCSARSSRARRARRGRGHAGHAGAAKSRRLRLRHMRKKKMALLGSGRSAARFRSIDVALGENTGYYYFVSWQIIFRRVMMPIGLHHYRALRRERSGAGRRQSSSRSGPRPRWYACCRHDAAAAGVIAQTSVARDATCSAARASRQARSLHAAITAIARADVMECYQRQRAAGAASSGVETMTVAMSAHMAEGSSPKNSRE